MTPKDLRARAEAAVHLTRREVAELTEDDVQRVIHELQVHQIELEIQNETLRCAQRDLEHSQEDYQELFDCAPAGYVLLDRDGRILRSNDSALRILGASQQSLRSQKLHRFCLAADQPLLEQCLHAANVSTSCELRLVTQGGVRHARADVSTPPSRTDTCLVALTDISERMLTQQALEQVNQELETRVAERTHELAARNRQLEAEFAARAETEQRRLTLEARLREAERLKSLGLMAAGIAHDFNNLLVSVLGHSELLLATPGLSDEVSNPLKLIRCAGSQAAELTRQLLVYAGRGQPNMAAISLPNVMTENLELLRALMPKGIEVHAQIEAELPLVLADRSQLSQVVMNLVTNAIEALDSEGKIELRACSQTLDAVQLSNLHYNNAARPGHFAVLEVTDSGPGIDAEDAAHMFDPFFSTKFAGRGLGLASVLGIVQSHRGALHVQTQLGQGTCFKVALPLATALRDTGRPPLQTRSEPWHGSGRVLLVDDDGTVRRVVAKLIASFGFDVTDADGGERALELLREAEPAFKLVVLDWMMPGVSGSQVLKALRVLQPQLPVILISGYSAEDLAAYDERVLCVQKPMTSKQLQDAIGTLLGPPTVERTA